MLSIGIDIGGTKTVFGLVDDQGRIIKQMKIRSEQALGKHSTPAASLAAALQDFSSQATFSLSSVQGVGIGIPGVIDRSTESVANCPNLEVLNGERLGADLGALLGIPAFLDNDVNLIALGEHLFGRGKGIADMAAVYVGSGIGCGLILDDRLYRGSSGATGEFGHTPVEPNGIPCTCGGIGCLEMYCSGKALTLQAKDVLGQAVALEPDEASGISWSTAKLVLDAARDNNPRAQKAVEQAFYYLGIGITTLVDILNPSLVLLGGGIITAWPEGIEITRQVVQRRARKVIRDRIAFAQGSLGEHAGLIGAAMLVSERLAAVP